MTQPFGVPDIVGARLRDRSIPPMPEEVFRLTVTQAIAELAQALTPDVLERCPAVRRLVTDIEELAWRQEVLNHA